MGVLSAVFDEFLTAIGIDKFKFFAILAGLIVVGILAFIYIHRGDVIDKLKEDKVVLTVDNKLLTNEANLDNKLDAVQEKANVSLVKNTKKVSDTHTTIANDTDTKVKVIEDTFNKDPNKTDPKVIDETQTKISTVYIDSLWSEYCSNTTNTACPKQS
jgi:hypothetical protein